MADHAVLTIGGVAVVLLGMVMVNQMMAKRPLPQDKDERPVDAMLCQFVVHDGSVVGETVAEDGEHLIIKQAGVFRAVARKQLRPEGSELLLTGTVDWAEAERLGSAWYDRVKGEGAEEVAGTMTRSEDVRAPAREAFAKREEERSGHRATGTREEE